MFVAIITPKTAMITTVYAHRFHAVMKPQKCPRPADAH
jgi:hypothetical protein